MRWRGLRSIVLSLLLTSCMIIYHVFSDPCCGEGDARISRERGRQGGANEHGCGGTATDVITFYERRPTHSCSGCIKLGVCREFVSLVSHIIRIKDHFPTLSLIAISLPYQYIHPYQAVFTLNLHDERVHCERD